METTNWLTKGMTDEQIQKEKDKAIKQAEKELTRIENKEKKKEMRAYRKMHRRHRKELVKLAKETHEWNWSWLHEMVIMQIRHMHEYYSAGNNVWQSEESLNKVLESLKHVLDLQDELDSLWDYEENADIKRTGNIVTTSAESTEKYINLFEKEYRLYNELYTCIGSSLQLWWD